jgi:BirA family biotin operon repressor/biotin-[acetyl-CoA-carboxylase] ligase
LGQSDKLEERMAGLGLRLVHLAEIESTNALASSMAADGEAEGLVVLADSQTAGRGRQGRSWISPSGCGLFVSFLRRPTLPARDAWLWTALAGTALHAAVADLREEVWLKWPNDLFVGERKLGGILCELQTGPGRDIESVVVGLGLNLFDPPGGWPGKLATSAGSVWPNAAPEASPQRRDALLLRLATQFLLLEVDLAGAGRDALLLRYRNAMAPMLGRQVVVTIGGQTIEVRVEGISDKGALEVVDGKGQRRSLLAGDVHLHGQGAIPS